MEQTAKIAFSKIWFSFIQNNPTKNWNWDDICRNPNLTWEIVSENLKSSEPKPWVWWCLSINPSITMDIIRNNPDKSWDWKYVSKNPNLTLDFLTDNLDKDWDWYSVSSNPGISINDILNTLNSELNYQWCNWGAFANPSITWDIFNDIVNGVFVFNKCGDCDFGISWDIVKMNIDYPWSWCFSKNSNITWEIVVSNPDFPWNFRGLSLNPNITWDIILENMASDNPLNWSWMSLSKKPGITLDIIRSNLDKELDWIELSSHPDITWENIQQNLGGNFKWIDKCIAVNPNMTLEMLITVHRSKFFWKRFCSNINVSWGVITNNLNSPDPINWDWKSLSSNPMTKWRDEFIREYIRCQSIKNDLYAVCGQPAWLFSHCMSPQERFEVDATPEFIEEAKLAMPLNLNHLTF
jgi:hypothetical protein